METERLVIDKIRQSDKEDYFKNISHDRRVLETFICRYAETLDEFDITPYVGRVCLPKGLIFQVQLQCLNLFALPL